MQDKSKIFEFYRRRFHKNQHEAWQKFYETRFLTIKAGRRWGKSYLCSEIIIDEGFKTDSSFPITSGISFIAKTKDQARDILWDTFKFRIRERGVHKLIKLNEQKLEAKFPNGIVLSVEGADVEEDRLRGSGKRLVICDEFAFWKRNKYLWLEILRPMLISPTGGDGGKAVICSTPANAENYFEDLYQRGVSKEEGYLSLHYRTHDNPMLSERELENIALDYGGSHTEEYRREILAETIRTSDLVFRAFEDKHPLVEELNSFQYWNGENYTFPSRDFIYFGGLDFGQKDPTVFLFCVLDWENDHLYVIDEHYKSHDLIKNHANKIKEIIMHKSPIIYADHQAQEVYEYMHHGINLMLANKDIRTGISRLISRIETKKITIIRDRCPNLIREMTMMVWDERKDKPAHNQDDHAIDALRYIVKGINMGNFEKPRAETEEERIERTVIEKLKRQQDDREWEYYD